MSRPRRRARASCVLRRYYYWPPRSIHTLTAHTRPPDAQRPVFDRRRCLHRLRPRAHSGIRNRRHSSAHLVRRLRNQVQQVLQAIGRLHRRVPLGRPSSRRSRSRAGASTLTDRASTTRMGRHGRCSRTRRGDRSSGIRRRAKRSAGIPLSSLAAEVARTGCVSRKMRQRSGKNARGGVIVCGTRGRARLRRTSRRERCVPPLFSLSLRSLSPALKSSAHSSVIVTSRRGLSTEDTATVPLRREWRHPITTSPRRSPSRSLQPAWAPPSSTAGPIFERLRARLRCRRPTRIPCSPDPSQRHQRRVIPLLPSLCRSQPSRPSSPASIRLSLRSRRISSPAPSRPSTRSFPSRSWGRLLSTTPSISSATTPSRRMRVPILRLNRLRSSSFASSRGCSRRRPVESRSFRSPRPSVAGRYSLFHGPRHCLLVCSALATFVGVVEGELPATFSARRFCFRSRCCA